MRNKTFFVIFFLVVTSVVLFPTVIAQEIQKTDINSPEKQSLNESKSKPRLINPDSKKSFKSIKNTDIKFSTDIEKYEVPNDLNSDKNEKNEIFPNLISGKVPVSITKATNKETNNKDIVTPENSVEMIYKGSVVLNGQTILYFGSSNIVEAVKRSLDIQATIKNSLYKSARKNNYDLVAEVKPYGNDYIIYLNNETILRVTSIDARINNVSQKRLSEVWKYNIDTFIRNNITKIKVITPLELLRNITYGFLVSCLILGFLELLRVHTKKHSKKLTKIFLRKLQKSVHQMRFKKNSFVYDSQEELINSQIDHITLQIGIITDIIIKITQLITLFIFAIFVLYKIPVTYMYIDQFAHYLISYVTVAGYSFMSWFTSEETWSSCLSLIIIIFQGCILIYIFKIFYSIAKNIIHILFVGDIVKIKRLETVFLIIERTLEIIIIIIAIFLILMELGINLGPVLAGAGIAGLAISFGAQNLIKDIINGVFILAENQFGIGDWIKISDCSGTVEDMTLRTTVIRDLSGVVHIIPNGKISQVSVYTKNWSRANLDISIAYKEDIDKAISLIKETADKMYQELSDAIIAEPIVLGVNSLGDSSIDIKIIMDTVAGEQWQVEREFLRRIKYVFDQNKIEIPFPHRTVYMITE